MTHKAKGSNERDKMFKVISFRLNALRFHLWIVQVSIHLSFCRLSFLSYRVKYKLYGIVSVVTNVRTHKTVLDLGVGNYANYF